MRVVIPSAADEEAIEAQTKKQERKLAPKG